MFGPTIKEVEPYIAPKTDMFSEYKKAVFGKPFDSSLNVPIMKWVSNNVENIKGIAIVNKYFFAMSKEMIMRSIVLHKRVAKITKYPKKPKDDNKLSFLIEYICKYHGWSEREYELNKQFIDLEDAELHEILDIRFGFDKKECRALGIKRIKTKVKFQDKPVVKGFF